MYKKKKMKSKTSYFGPENVPNDVSSARFSRDGAPWTPPKKKKNSLSRRPWSLATFHPTCSSSHVRRMRILSTPEVARRRLRAVPFVREPRAGDYTVFFFFFRSFSNALANEHTNNNNNNNNRFGSATDYGDDYPDPQRS